MDDTKKLYLSWKEVDTLIDGLIPRLQSYDYEVVIVITRGGIIPGGIIARRLAISQVLVASVDFYEDETHKLDWPVFMQFPADSFLRGKQVLIVDDIWDRGKQVVSVSERVEQAGGTPISVVLHYKSQRSQFEDKSPNFYAVETTDWIIYPWEIDRGILGVT
ncbi:phosphoribosyltransferase family protein [Anaerolineales bacterium HSG6]|nr:phosphoribosyltransferase family protein [Anaerolineales bacterium HSG6]MDM8530193.1 phosphoribosyltransferase family protein [Anaerolineales bacterium HSG25]